MLSKRYLIVVVAMLLSGLMLLSACQSEPTPSASTSIPEYVIQASEYAFTAPLELPAGQVYIRLENAGVELHHLQLMRLNDGVTLEQFNAALAESEEVVFGLVSFSGGVGVLEPDGSGRVLLDLAEGQYVLACFVPAPDGVLHLAKGMFAPIKVSTSASSVAAPKPEASVNVTLKDFSFDIIGDITPGSQLWQISNAGPQPHELMLIRLNEGKTLDDLGAYMQAPTGAAPFEWQGGMQALTPGKEGLVSFDLEPGNYVLVCNIPDFTSGHSHAEMGMLLPLSVREGQALDGSVVETELDSFEDALTQAILERDFDRLPLMVDEIFTLVYYHGDGAPYGPADVAEELRAHQIGADTHIEFHSAQDLIGTGAETLFQPETNVVKMIFVTGWGLEGSDEAVLYIARRPEGGIYLRGLLVARGGFEAANAPDPILAMINGFTTELSKALEAHDYDMLNEAIGDQFNVIYWLADGQQFSNAEAIAHVRDDLVLAGNDIASYKDADLIKILGGINATGFLNSSESSTVRAVYVTGLGVDEKGEGVILVGQRSDGSMYWPGLIYAAGGFSGLGQATPPFPELFSVGESAIDLVMPSVDVKIYAGPGDGYDVVGGVFGGQQAKVTGLSADGNWWRVICPDDSVGDCFIPLGPEVEALSSN